MKTAVLVMMVVWGGLLGCNRASEPTAAPSTSPAVAPAPTGTAPSAPAAKPSIMDTLVDGFTGKAVIQKGIETREKVKAINAKEEKDLEEALK